MRIGSGSFFSSRQAGWAAGVVVAAMMFACVMARAQNAGAPPTPASVDHSTAAASGQVPAADSGVQTSTGATLSSGTPAAQTSAPTTTVQTAGQSTAPATSEGAITNGKPAKKGRVAKEDQVKSSKDTQKALKEETKLNPIADKDAQLPDRQLYDKALAQAKSGHYDVARLDLQTLLNAYPDSQYQMRAKLEVANCWYEEGGSAALAQAEQEYTDFITFFPNAPEAPEAQMRIGDIYFKQMDVPDRDYTKALKAEEAYRTMLKQYPDAVPKLLAEDKQKLREVQEVMATREAELGAFYASHENWAASIARYQTVVDTYPQYSHMDDALIGVGDGYAADAHNIRITPVCGTPGLAPGTQCLPEAAKAQLLETYDGRAADAYRKVVLLHSAAPHVEDAKERLAAMNLPIPTPTPEQIAASDALEGSRAQYTMAKRLKLLFLRTPDTVLAPTIGDPPLDDPQATTAPSIINQLLADYKDAYNPAAAAAARDAAKTKAATDAATTPAPAATTTPTVVAPLAFQDVPTQGQASTDGSSSTMTEAAPSGSGTGVGVEIITPGAGGPPTTGTPAKNGTQDPNNGLTAVGPKNSDPLPPVEKVGEAPDQVNELSGQTQPAQTGTAPVNDKKDESSSKHKPKTGLDKLNPF